VLPELAEKVRICLLENHESDLADQIGGLRVWGRCPCGDDFCSSFYTGPRTLERWSDEGVHRTVPLLVAGWMVNLDTVAGVIRYIEVIGHPDFANNVAGFPPLPKD
jgi:hypothetical protein